eukprot:scaffold1551_cov19-Prasinocladus_malaysianus.AAC.1
MLRDMNRLLVAHISSDSVDLMAIKVRLSLYKQACEILPGEQTHMSPNQVIAYIAHMQFRHSGTSDNFTLLSQNSMVESRSKPHR